MALMGGGFLASVVAQMFFYRASKTGRSAGCRPWGGVAGVRFFLSVLIFHEPLTRGKVFGIFLVTMGVLFLK
jgi:uncharacterized membrane protein